jgi:hypothetical protein
MGQAEELVLAQRSSGCHSLVNFPQPNGTSIVERLVPAHENGGAG